MANPLEWRVDGKLIELPPDSSINPICKVGKVVQVKEKPHLFRKTAPQSYDVARKGSRWRSAYEGTTIIA
jgi:hypothetical protein